jgi:hypothetical protein
MGGQDASHPTVVCPLAVAARPRNTAAGVRSCMVHYSDCYLQMRGNWKLTKYQVMEKQAIYHLFSTEERHYLMSIAVSRNESDSDYPVFYRVSREKTADGGESEQEVMKRRR